MKKFFLAFALFIFSFGFSQLHRFVYELQFKRDSTAKKTDTLKLVLDIDAKDVRFYELEFLRIDSISKSKNEDWQTNSTTQQLLKRSIGSSVNQNYRDNLFDYYVIESKDDLKWKILPETKKVAEYHLQKAETNFGGRHWEAWFTTEIPISEGPYKFRGLPGLIFEVQDSKQHYVYKLVNSKKLEKSFDTSNFLETHYGNKPLKITYVKLNEIKLNYYNDPYSWAKSSSGTWSVSFGDGITYNKKEDIPYLTKRAQEDLRKSNNPIELDNALKYPLK